jgi:hypothetical protein
LSSHVRARRPHDSRRDGGATKNRKKAPAEIAAAPSRKARFRFSCATPLCSSSWLTSPYSCRSSTLSHPYHNYRRSRQMRSCPLRSCLCCSLLCSKRQPCPCSSSCKTSHPSCRTLRSCPRSTKPCPCCPSHSCHDAHSRSEHLSHLPGPSCHRISPWPPARCFAGL